MALYKTLDQNCAFALVVYYTCVLIIVGQEWSIVYNSGSYKQVSFPDDLTIQTSIVSVELTTQSAMYCTWFCWRRHSVSVYYVHSDDTCYCNNALDTRLLVDSDCSSDMSGDVQCDGIYMYLNESVTVSTNSSMLTYDIMPYKKYCCELFDDGYRTSAIYTVQRGGQIEDTYCDMEDVAMGPTDCLNWLQCGYRKDGVYTIRLSNGQYINASCDQQHGGWTVLQHREDGLVDFYRTWAEYVNGFGDISDEHWLGLEAVYLLTQRSSTLYIHVETEYAMYDSFALSSSADRYRLTVSGFTGTVGDSLQIHNGQQFQTMDRAINDCPIKHHGAWWFEICFYSHLNGLYGSDNGLVWATWKGWEYSLKSTTMKIKRNE